MQRRRSFRALLLSAGAVAACLQAASAGTVSPHHLSASVGSGPATQEDFTSDPNESSVSVSYQNGVPGTDPQSRYLSASVDSASGVLITSGLTDTLTVPNKGDAVALLQQRMVLDGDGPVEIDATLLLSGSGSGGYITLDASLHLGGCIVGVRRYFGSENPPDVASNNCNDTAAVTWDESGSAGALHITATFANQPSAIDIEAWVSGDFGGSVSDIPDGQFSSSGSLSIDVVGSTATFASPTFLTGPEPGHATLLCVGGLARLVARRRGR